MFLVFLNHFNLLILKIIFFLKIIGMYFNTKNYLKNNSNYTIKRASGKILIIRWLKKKVCLRALI
jgi:hypothetical protein